MSGKSNGAGKGYSKNNSFFQREEVKRLEETALKLFGNRRMPHSRDAERAVLGSMLIDRSAISKVVEILDEEDAYYFEENKIIYRAILDLFNENKSVDILILAEKLGEDETLDSVGGALYLAEIADSTPTAANVQHYAMIVQEKFLKRKLIYAAGAIAENSFAESGDALEDIDYAESKIFEITSKKYSDSYAHIKRLAKEAYEYISDLYADGSGRLSGLSSGYKDLDEMTGGFQKSDLIIIAARPSVGKTALGLSMARNIAVEHKKKVAFFSLEMDGKQLVIRLLSAEMKIDQQKIRTGRLNYEKEEQNIVDALGKLSSANIYIDDSPSLSVTELRAKCRRLASDEEIDIVIIDYLQFIHPPKAESREREISIISRTLKQIAKEMDIPVVALAQLNRSIESRTDKRPMLSDLRESGSIEQDADLVIFINRPEVYKISTFPDGTPSENRAELIIAKQRNGRTGTIRLAYIKDYARFENLAEVDMPDDFYEDEDAPDQPF